MKRKWIILFIAFIWVPSILVIRLNKIWNSDSITLNNTSQESIELISDRLGVEPEWANIRKYLKSNIYSGMTREEVISCLNRIAPWYSRYDILYKDEGFDLIISQVPEFTEHVYFVDVNNIFMMGKTWSIKYKYGIVESIDLLDS